MFLKKITAAFAAAALSAVMLAVPADAAVKESAYTDLSENILHSIFAMPFFSPRAVRERASRTNSPDIYSYSAAEHTVTLNWNGTPNADGYYVYVIDGEDSVLVTQTNGETFAVVENLASGREYTFKVQSFIYSGGEILKSSKSKSFSAVTAPARRGAEITGISRDREKNTVTLSWDGSSTGSVIYAYDFGEEKWERAAAAKNGKNSYTFRLDAPANGADTALGDIQGNEYGYRFALKSYSRDENELHTYWSRLSKMDDPYYDLDDLKAFFGSELQLAENVLAANYTGKSSRLYTFYSTSADEEGVISSSSRQVFISDASIEAIEKFSAEHFGDDWTDAEKLMYTVNWINKNVTYDIEYKAPGKGYADNIFTYRLGQCDSYNGTLAEMLTYWGYDGVFLQCMTNSVRFSQHLRAGIISGGRNYTFESGNDKRSKGWVWLMKEGMEVPFEGTLNISEEEEAERSVKYMEDLAKAFFDADKIPAEINGTGNISLSFGNDEESDEISDEEADLFLLTADDISAMRQALEFTSGNDTEEDENEASSEETPPAETEQEENFSDEDDASEDVSAETPDAAADDEASSDSTESNDEEESEEAVGAENEEASAVPDDDTQTDGENSENKAEETSSAETSDAENPPDGDNAADTEEKEKNE